MEIDIVRLILLIFSFFSLGKPDGFDTAYKVAFEYSPNQNTLTLAIKIDPVAYYYRPLPPNLCGLAIYSYFIVDPKHPEKGCENTFSHELNHIWQGRTYGYLLPITYLFDANIWEAKPVWTDKNMPDKKDLNFSLIKIYLTIFSPK